MNVVSSVLSIGAAVLAFAFLIVVHELGHALAARLVGMRIVRFSVGYGKVLWSRRWRETELALSAIPVGGYCWIGGMLPDDGVDPAAPHAWNNQPAWKRTLAIAAGPAASYLGAVVVAAVLFVAIGVPTAAPLVGDVLDASPAAQAGLRTGDRVLSVDGVAVDAWNPMVEVIQRSGGKAIPVVVERGEGGAAQRVTLTLTPRGEPGKAKAGFGQLQRLERRPAGRALADAFVQTNVQMVGQLRGIARLFTGKASTGDLSGPIGIGRTLAKGARMGADVFFTIIWILSVALAVLNLLPIPPLDGGKLVFLGWEMATRRRASEKVELAVSWAGFLLLATLFLAVTVFGDIPRLFR